MDAGDDREEQLLIGMVCHEGTELLMMITIKKNRGCSRRLDQKSREGGDGVASLSLTW